MVARTASLIVRAIRLAPVLSCLFAGCTCSSGPVVSPTPTATPTSRATQPPPTVPHPTDTPVPPPPAATSTLPPAPNPEVTANAADSACGDYVAVLSGKKQDKALLENPAVRALAQQAPDLVKCGAVRLDSEALCMLLGSDPEQGLTKECVLMQELFHELRAYPKSHSFFMTETEWRGCHASPLAPICDALREALRSGDASKCALKADFRSVCRGMLTNLDEVQCGVVGPHVKRIMEARCRAAVTLDASVCHIEGADEKRTHGAKFDFKELFKGGEDECKQKTEERAFLGKGLNVLAESGPPRERELAKAALGQTDACAPYARAAMESCKGSSPGASVPAGTSPPAGNGPGSAPAGNQGNPN
jgi:hypothetical protein